MKSIIKKILPEKILKILRRVNTFRKCMIIYRQSAKIKKKSDKFLFLIMTPEHENLGDHAIAKAENLLLCDYTVFEIPNFTLLDICSFPFILKRIFKNSTIVFNGGGNMGTLWPETETVLIKIMQQYKDNRIFIFPQTVYYEDSDFGRKALEKSKKIYNACSDLTIFAREKTSYEFMKKVYRNVYLMPDMVLSLNECKSDCHRSGVQLTLRYDCEKTMNDAYYNQLLSFCKDKFCDKISFVDMIADYPVRFENRNEALDRQFEKFRQSELVITDRLHGMIFAAITGTPCIVLNSKSPKVKGVYDWIFKDCEYIIFTEDFDEMDSFISFIQGKKFVYDDSLLRNYYEKMQSMVL